MSAKWIPQRSSVLVLDASSSENIDTTEQVGSEVSKTDFDEINPGSKASREGVKEQDVVEAINDCSTDGLSSEETHRLLRDSLNCLQLTLRRDDSSDSSPKMFKSSKSIELNGTNTKDKSAKSGDGKGGSIPSSPISITVSSTKKELAKTATPPELGGPLPPPPGFSDSFEESWNFRGVFTSCPGDVVSTSQPLKREPLLLTNKELQLHRHRPYDLCLDAARSQNLDKESLSLRRSSNLGDGSLPCSPCSPFSPGRESERHSSPDSTGSWWDERRGSDPRRRDSSSSHSNVSDVEWKEKIRKFATTVQTSICSPLQESVPLPGSEEAAKATEDLLKNGTRSSANVVNVASSSKEEDGPAQTSSQWLSVEQPPVHGPLLSAQSSSDSVTLTDLAPIKLERVFITTDDDTDIDPRANVHRLQVPISTKADSRQSSTETTSDALSDRLYDFTAMPIDSRQSSTEVTSETSTDIMPRSDSSETRSRTASIESRSNSSEDFHKTDSKSDSSTLVVLAEKQSIDKELDDFDRPSEIEVSGDLSVIMKPSSQNEEDSIITPPTIEDITLIARPPKFPHDEVSKQDNCSVSIVSESVDTPNKTEEFQESAPVSESSLPTPDSNDTLIITITESPSDETEAEGEKKQRNPLIKTDSWDLISDNLSEELSQLIANFGESICTKPLDLGKSHSLEETDQGSGGGETALNKSPNLERKISEKTDSLDNKSDEVKGNDSTQLPPTDSTSDKILPTQTTVDITIDVPSEENEYVKETVESNIKNETEENTLPCEQKTTDEEDQMIETVAVIETTVDHLVETIAVQTERKSKTIIKETCDIGIQDERSPYSSPSFTEEFSNGSGSKSSMHIATQTEESSLSKALRQRERTISVAQDVSDVSLQTDESETLDDLASLKSDEVASLPSEGATTPVPEEVQEANKEVASTQPSTERIPTTEPTLTDITELPSAYLNSANFSVEFPNEKTLVTAVEEDEEECTDTLVLIDAGDEPPSDTILTIAYSGEDIDTMTDPMQQNIAKEQTMEIMQSHQQPKSQHTKLIVQSSGEEDHLSPSYFDWGLSECEYADASVDSGEGSFPKSEEFPEEIPEDEQATKDASERKESVGKTPSKYINSTSIDVLEMSKKSTVKSVAVPCLSVIQESSSVEQLTSIESTLPSPSVQVAHEATTDFREESVDSLHSSERKSNKKNTVISDQKDVTKIEKEEKLLLSNTFKYAHLGIISGPNQQIAIGHKEHFTDRDSTSSIKGSERSLRLTRMGSSISRESSLKTEDESTQWSPQEECKDFPAPLTPRAEMEDKETQSDIEETEGCPSCRKVEFIDKAIQSEIEKHLPLNLLFSPTSPEYKDKQTQVELLKANANDKTQIKRYIPKLPPLQDSHDKEVQSDFLSPCFPIEYLRFVDLDNTRPRDLDDPYRLRRYTLPRTARTTLLQELEDRGGDAMLDVDAVEGTHSLGELQEKDVAPREGLHRKYSTFVTNPRTRAVLVEELMGRGALSDGEEWAKSKTRREHRSGRQSKVHKDRGKREGRRSHRPTTSHASEEAVCNQTTMDSPENPVQNGKSNNVTTYGERSTEPQPQHDSSVRSSTPPADQMQAKTTTILLTQAEIHSTQVSTVEKCEKENQDGIWSPKQTPTQTSDEPKQEEKSQPVSEETIAPIWKPFRSPYEDKLQYKPVKIESISKQESDKTEDVKKSSSTPPTPPLKSSSGIWESKKPPFEQFQPHEVKDNTSKSQLSPTFVRLNGSSHLPRSQSPTITLLQKRREGQIPKSTVYVDHKMNSKDEALSNVSSSIPALNDNLFCVKSAEIHDDYRKIHLEPIKHQGIGPIDEQGLPVTLRTVIKDENKTEWYKKMYRSLHRLGDSSEDDYVVVKYRRRGRIPYSSSGYMSEPEPERDDYYINSKFSTLDRRRPKFNEELTSRDKSPTSLKGKSNISSWSPPSARYSSDIYKNQPRKIEDYEPGRSSIAEREAKLDEEVDQHGTRYKPSGEKTLSSHLFKDGYESDSSLVYKKHSSEKPSALEQRMWYREIQKGGDIPLTGLRKAVPERPKDMEDYCMYHFRTFHRHPNKPPFQSITYSPVSETSHVCPETYTDLQDLVPCHCPVCHHDSFHPLCLGSPLPVEFDNNTRTPSPPRRTVSKINPSLVQWVDTEIKTGTPRRPPLPVSLVTAQHYLPRPFGSPPSPSIYASTSRSASSNLTDASKSFPISPVTKHSLKTSVKHSDCADTCNYPLQTNSGSHSKENFQSTTKNSNRLPNNFDKTSNNYFSSLNSSLYLHKNERVKEKKSDFPQSMALPPSKDLRFQNNLKPESLNAETEKCSSYSASPELISSLHHQRFPSSETGYQSSNDLDSQQNPEETQSMVNQVLRSIQNIRKAYESEQVFQEWEKKVKSIHQIDSKNKVTANKPLTKNSKTDNPKNKNFTYQIGYYVPKRKSRSHSPPNISYRQYILSILKTLKTSERFLLLQKCYNRLDYLAKLEKYLCERERVLFKQNKQNYYLSRSASLTELDKLYAELDKIQEEKRFFYKAHKKEHVQWKKDRDYGLRSREKSLEDLRKIYSDLHLFKKHKWFTETPLYHSCNSVSELVNRYSSFEKLHFPELFNIPIKASSKKTCLTCSRNEHGKRSNKSAHYAVNNFDPIDSYHKSLPSVPSMPYSFSYWNTKSKNYSGNVREDNFSKIKKTDYPSVSFKEKKSNRIIQNFAEDERKSRDYVNDDDIRRRRTQTRDKRMEDVLKSPNAPVCWWNNKVATCKKSFEENFTDDLRLRSQSLPRNLKIHSHPSYINKYSCESVTPSSQYNKHDRKLHWSQQESSEFAHSQDKNSYLSLSHSSSWNEIPIGRQKHSTMFQQKKYPPPVTYFLPNYVPERTVSTIDLSSANLNTIPFGHLHKKTDIHSQSSILSGSVSEDISKGKQPVRVKIVSGNTSKFPLFKIDNDISDSKGLNKTGNFYLSYVKKGDVKKLHDKFEAVDSLAQESQKIEKIVTMQPLRKILSADNIFAKKRTPYAPTIPSWNRIEKGTVQKIREKFEKEKLLNKSLKKEQHLGSLPCLSNISKLSPKSYSFQKKSNTTPDRLSSYTLKEANTGDVDKLRWKFEKRSALSQNLHAIDCTSKSSLDNLLYISVTTSKSSPDITIDLGNVDLSDEITNRHMSAPNLMKIQDNGKKTSLKNDNVSNFHKKNADSKTFNQTKVPLNNLDYLWRKYSGINWGSQNSKKTVGKNIVNEFDCTSNSPSPDRQFTTESEPDERTYTYSPLISSTPVPVVFLQNNEEDDSPQITPASSPEKMDEMRNCSSPVKFHGRSKSPNEFAKSRQLPSPSSSRSSSPCIKRKEPTSSPPVRLSHSTSIESTTSPFDLSLLPPVPAPPPKIPLVDVGPESPHRYLESEVNIHYKAPIRALEKEYIEEEELKLRQQEMMKQFYEEEKKKKYLQELSDIENRRHSDNFTPSQKSPIPLDRYDNPFESSVSPQPRARTPEPKTVARARYNFTAQNIRELSFNKGDIIIITRQIDRNWYEGEHHGMIGLFPVNYVEVISYDAVRSTPKKLTEGLAKAKFHFRAQTSLELPLVKGELIILTRRVDHNWYMGRIGGREGIFPVSYVDVIREPNDPSRSPSSPVPKPVASPISRALIMNGSATTPHPLSYQQPNLYNQKLNSHQNPYATMRRYPPIRPPEPVFNEKKQPLDQSLHIDTQSEPIPYRALYDYQPQNEDELELREGDTVFVMEKCDDGWYVGSSLRSGVFGTFPGNYVERMCLTMPSKQ